MFKGVATALITPFNKEGVDYSSFAKMIEHQIASGIDALLICGTTGEPATMTAEEKREVKKFAIKQINKRVPVIIGTGSNNTQEAVRASVEAEQLGADMLLVVTPYYNKCTQNGLVAHYSAIAEAVNIPIMAYNVPGRTGVNILPATCKKLSAIKNIVALKDAAGNVSQSAETLAQLAGTGMAVYSGDDGLALPLLALGEKGLISVASNAIPKVMADMVHSYMDGNIDKCRDLYFKYRKFTEALFAETNPIPVKYACSKLGLCENILRLPLTPVSEENAQKIDAVMAELEVTL